MGEGGATDDSVPLTFPGGEAGLDAGAAPGVWLLSWWEQMAPDPRVPAAAAARRERPAGVRRGGWTRQGRKENLFSPGLWFLSAWGWSFTHGSLRLWRPRQRKTQVLPPLGDEQGLELPVPLTLKRAGKPSTLFFCKTEV